MLSLLSAVFSMFTAITGSLFLITHRLSSLWFLHHFAFLLLPSPLPAFSSYLPTELSFLLVTFSLSLCCSTVFYYFISFHPRLSFLMLNTLLSWKHWFNIRTSRSTCEHSLTLSSPNQGRCRSPPRWPGWRADPKRGHSSSLSAKASSASDLRHGRPQQVFFSPPRPLAALPTSNWRYPQGRGDLKDRAPGSLSRRVSWSLGDVRGGRAAIWGWEEKFSYPWWKGKWWIVIYALLSLVCMCVCVWIAV